jgi:ATP-dependent DNA helicase RecG
VSETPFIDEIADDIRHLRAAGTDLTRLEVKSAGGGLPTALWATVSAFANAGGGRIILGLDEATGFVPAAGFDAAAMRDRVITGLREKVEPTPPATVEIAPFDGAQLLAVDIEELAPHRKPCFVVAQGKERGSYRRAGDGDHRMSTYEVFLHSSNVQQPQDDVGPVEGALIEDLDEVLVQGLLNRLRGQQRAAVEGVDDLEALRRLNVLTRGSGTSRPTVAGILALGAYPQQFFPQWMVTVAVYPGPTKDSVVGDVRMLDQATVDGPIPLVVERSVGVLLRNLRGSVRSQGATAVTTPEIPVDVLREAVTNALTHRDYSDFARGEQVRVEVFPDRVEVISPGGVWGGRSERDLLDGVSRSRNEKLALLLQDVPLPTTGGVVCENRGSGIPRMIGLMRQQGLALPVFRDRTTTFTCTLARYGLLDPETHEALDNAGAGSLEQQQKAVLALVLRGQPVDDQVVRHQLGIDTLDARTLLSALARDGWLAPPTASRASYGVSARLRQPSLFGDDHTPSAQRSAANQAILDAFQPGDVLDVHTIRKRAGLSLQYTRARLRILVAADQVEATAPPTSRRRRYRLPGGRERPTV